MKPQIIVWRNNCRILINRKYLVPGDIVEISTGDQIPADIKLFQCRNLLIDQITVTGEKQPKFKYPINQISFNNLDVKNILFNQTYCMEGWGKGIVIRTANNTLMGQIKNITNKSHKKYRQSLFLQHCWNMENVVVKIGIITAYMLFIALFMLYRDFYFSLQCAITILMVIISTKIGIIMNINLYNSIKKLNSKKISIQNKQSLYTIAMTKFLCTDRTAVITQNNINISHLWYDNNLYKAQNKQIHGNLHKYQYNENNQTFKLLKNILIICTEASFDKQYKNKNNINNYCQCKYIGNALQGAIIKFLQPIQDIESIRNKYKFAIKKQGNIAKLPYNNTRKYTICIIQEKGQFYQYIVYIMGFVDRIWRICDKIIMEGKSIEISKQIQNNFQNICTQKYNNGQKAMGVAMLKLKRQYFPHNFKFDLSNPLQFDFPLQNFTYIGTIFLADIPKKGCSNTFNNLIARQIQPIIMSSQTLQSVSYLATKIGIQKTNIGLQKQGKSQKQAFQNADAIIFDGLQLTQDIYDSRHKLQQLLTKQQVVFSSLDNNRKKQIINFYRYYGIVTYVAGNDSLQSLQADILISNGIQARKTLLNKADIVLCNDDFSSIIEIINQGRKIIDNVKKCLIFRFSLISSLILPLIISLGLQFPLPLTPLQIIIIIFIIQFYQSISLSYQQQQNYIKQAKSYQYSQSLIPTKLLIKAVFIIGMIITFGGLFNYFYVMDCYGFNVQMTIGLMKQNVTLPQKFNIQNGSYQFDIKYNNENNDCIFNQNMANLGCPALILPCKHFNKQQHFSFLQEPMFPDWIHQSNSAADLRPFYSKCHASNLSYTPYYNYTQQAHQTYNQYNNHKVAYTTEALPYAQSAYFFTIILLHIFNIIICKTRRDSLIQNYKANLHILLSICVTIFLLMIFMESQISNQIFGLRQVQVLELAVPAVFFGIILFIIQEILKKIVIKNRNKYNKIIEFLKW